MLKIKNNKYILLNLIIFFFKNLIFSFKIKFFKKIVFLLFLKIYKSIFNKFNINNIFTIYSYIKFKKKIKKLKNLFSIFKYDLIFRFPKLSFKNSAKILKKNLLELRVFKKYFKKKNTSNWYIYFRLPTTGGIGNYFNSIFKRSAHLLIGSFNKLPLNYTNSGYYSPYITRAKKKKFFCKLSRFVFIAKYKLFYNQNLNLFEKYKMYYVFFSQKPNVNLYILFFSTLKKKHNFFEYSSFSKQYNVFSKKYDSFNFLKLNWLLSKKKIANNSKKITNINLQNKQKHILKFHRNSFNTFFLKKYRSNKLSKIFKKITNNNLKFFKQYILLETTLLYLLLRTNFALTLNDSRWLINNGFIFVNKIICYNEYYNVKKLDKIQLINSNYEFIHHRFIISNSVTRYCRMWYSLNRYYLTLNKPYKTQPSTERKWLIKSLWNHIDIPKFTEVDFLILTIIIIYNPLTNIDLAPFYFNYFKTSIIRMYNWKYYH